MVEKIIRKLLNNVFIRVFVWIWANIIQSISPKLWNIIEKKVFNPYVFWWNNISYTKELSEKIVALCKKYNIEIKWNNFLELWPGGFLWVWWHLKKHGISKYFALDIVNHFENVDNNTLELYKKIDSSLVVNWKLNNDFFNILIYSNKKIPIEDNSIDISFSHYVYEHVDSPFDSLKEISIVTKIWWYWIHEIWYLDHIFNPESLFYRIIPEKLFTFLFKKSWGWVNFKTHYFFRKNFKELWYEINNEEVISEYSKENMIKYKKLLNKYEYDDLKVSKAIFVIKKIKNYE